MIWTALLFIVLGIAIKYGKMYFLIAGYNTMPKEKRENYDIKGIAAVFGNTMFTMAAVIILGYFAADWFDTPRIEKLSLYGALMIGIPYLLIKTNSGKFKKDEFKE